MQFILVLSVIKKSFESTILEPELTNCIDKIEDYDIDMSYELNKEFVILYSDDAKNDLDLCFNDDILMRDCQKSEILDMKKLSFENDQLGFRTSDTLINTKNEKKSIFNLEKSPENFEINKSDTEIKIAIFDENQNKHSNKSKNLKKINSKNLDYLPYNKKNLDTASSQTKRFYNLRTKKYDYKHHLQNEDSEIDAIPKKIKKDSFSKTTNYLTEKFKLKIIYYPLKNLSYYDLNNLKAQSYSNFSFKINIINIFFELQCNNYKLKKNLRFLAFVIPRFISFFEYFKRKFQFNYLDVNVFIKNENSKLNYFKVVSTFEIRHIIYIDILDSLNNLINDKDFEKFQNSYLNFNMLSSLKENLKSKKNLYLNVKNIEKCLDAIVNYIHKDKSVRENYRCLDYPYYSSKEFKVFRSNHPEIVQKNFFYN